jgi:putative inorganic carbon (HCO3(-)) transporter
MGKKNKKNKDRGGSGARNPSPVSAAPAIGASNWTHKAIIWWLPILYLLISDSFFLRTYDSAQVKITLVQMGGICLLSLWLCRLLDEGKGVFTKNDLVTLAPFLAYFGYGVISYLHAPYKFSSLDAFLRRIFYMTVPLLVIREFDEKGINRLTKILILTTWITVGYGMLQWFDITFFPRGVGKGPDPFIWRGAFGPRVFSTFGNPNFYANFLVLIFPVLVCQYLKNRNFKLIPLIGMLLWTLYSTGTKGAWVGFSVSLSLLTATYVWFFDYSLVKRFWKKIVLAFIVLGCVLTAGIVYKLNHSRWTSVNFRLFTWLATWEMVMTQPLTGTGIGSFWVIYPAFRRPPIFHIEGKHNTETDHSENEWLEVLYDEGLLGFGIFLWLILCACTVAYGALGQMTGSLKKGQRAPPRAYDLLGYLIAFQGMLAHNVFDVSMRFVSSGVYLGLLSGLIVNLARGHSLQELHRHVSVDEESGGAWKALSSFLIWPLRLGAWGGLGWMAYTLCTQFAALQGPIGTMKLGGEILQWWIAWGCFLLCVLSQSLIFGRTVLLTRNALVPLVIIGMLWPLTLTWGFFRADVHHNIAIFFSKRKNWEQALKNYLIVGNLNPAFVMSFYFKGNVFNDRFNMSKIYNPNWGDRDQQPRDDFERAMEAYDQVRSKAPNYVQMHHQVGTLYLKRSDWERKQGRNEEAEKYVDLALERYLLYQKHDPVFAPNFFRIGQIYMARKQYDKAIENYKMFVDAHNCNVPDDVEQGLRWRKTIGAYQYYQQPDGDRWRHTHPDGQGYAQLANAYFLKGDLANAEKNYKMALKLNPNDEHAKRNLQVLYQKARAMGAIQAAPVVGPALPPPAPPKGAAPTVPVRP